MGFLSQVTGGAFNDDTGLSLAGSVTGMAIGGPVGAMLGGELFGRQSGGPGQYRNPEEERKYKEVRNKQAADAKKFRSDIPTHLSQLGENQDQQIRGKLYEDLYTSKANANKRGLLGSGLQRGADQGLRAQAGGEMAEKRAGLERELYGQADAMDDAYISAGQRQYEGDMNAADSAYKEALAKRQSDSAGLKGLFSAGGSLAGGYLGGKK